MTGLTKGHRITSSPRPLRFLAGGCLVALSLAGPARAADEADAFAAVAEILEQRCALPACHAGPDAPKGMRLEKEWIYRSTVNVPARTSGGLLRVAPGDPEGSKARSS